jgi:hypothetical protein
MIRRRESSLQVTKTTYSGLQEHRIIVYTATGQKARLWATIRGISLPVTNVLSINLCLLLQYLYGPLYVVAPYL